MSCHSGKWVDKCFIRKGRGTNINDVALTGILFLAVESSIVLCLYIVRQNQLAISVAFTNGIMKSVGLILLLLQAVNSSPTFFGGNNGGNVKLFFFFNVRSKTRISNSFVLIPFWKDWRQSNSLSLTLGLFVVTSEISFKEVSIKQKKKDIIIRVHIDKWWFWNKAEQIKSYFEKDISNQEELKILPLKN